MRPRLPTLGLNRPFLKMNHFKFYAPGPHTHDLSLTSTQFRYLQNKARGPTFTIQMHQLINFFVLKISVLRVSARHRVYSLKILIFFIGYLVLEQTFYKTPPNIHPIFFFYIFQGSFVIHLKSIESPSPDTFCQVWSKLSSIFGEKMKMIKVYDRGR